MAYRAEPDWARLWVWVDIYSVCVYGIFVGVFLVCFGVFLVLTGHTYGYRVTLFCVWVLFCVFGVFWLCLLLL